MNPDAFPTKDQLEQATAYIRERTLHTPTLGLILGSGLSPLAQEIAKPDIIPYAEIPHFPASTVKGHSGQLVVGLLAGRGWR